MEADTHTLKKKAQFAGILYLIWVITGIYGAMYVPSHTIVPGDAFATANKIHVNEFLFRTGIANDFLGLLVGIILILTLYQLLKPVNESQAKLMVALLIVTFPVGFIMDAFNIASLKILEGSVLKTFETGQRQDIAMLLFKINDNATITLEMFWGLWLLPFGWLVYNSTFIPRVLGVFLILNGVAYIIHCLSHILLPNYQVFIFRLSVPFWILGEISIMLWLLIWGVKTKRSTNDFN